MKPYQSCETCPRCFSGKCSGCPKLQAELRAFRQQIEGKIHDMAMQIWHPRTKPLTQQGGQSTKSEQQCVPARLQSLSTEHSEKQPPENLRVATEGDKLKLGTHGIAAEVGKHLLSGAQIHLAMADVSEECSGSNPDGSVPARLFLSENPIPLQDIGGQISMAKIPPNPPARRTEARRQFPSIRYELSIEGFSSCVRPPIQEPASDFAPGADLLFSDHKLFK